MTVGELLIEYEQNHVINLKSWRETSRRLRRRSNGIRSGRGKQCWCGFSHYPVVLW